MMLQDGQQAFIEKNENFHPNGNYWLVLHPRND